MSFVGNLVKFPAAMTKLASNAAKANAIRNATQKHLLEVGPTWQVPGGPKIDLQELEYMHDRYGQNCWGYSERSAFFVSHELGISRKDFTDMCITKNDLYKIQQPLWVSFLGGGVPALLGLPFWMASTHRLPSTFFSTEEQQRDAGMMRDLETHIKWGPRANYSHKKVCQFWASMDPKYNEAFDSMTDGFLQKRDPKACRKLAQWAGRTPDVGLFMLKMSIDCWSRGLDMKNTVEFLGMPWMHQKNRNLTARIIFYYRDMFQEDVLIQKEGGVQKLNDFELYEICSRRHIVRWEENLSRTRLEDRYEKWCIFTEIKPGYVPVPVSPPTSIPIPDHIPIRFLVLWQSAYFRDPGYLDATLEDLDIDAWPSAWNWANDAFQRRLEFENGPLALQVQQHVLAEQEEQKKYLDDPANGYAAAKA